MCQVGDVVLIRALLLLRRLANSGLLVCIGLAWGLPGRLAVTGDSMEAGPSTSWLRRICSVRRLSQ
jgi:hypothetical protein